MARFFYSLAALSAFAALVNLPFVYVQLNLMLVILNTGGAVVNFLIARDVQKTLERRGV